MRVIVPAVEEALHRMGVPHAAACRPAHASECLGLQLFAVTQLLQMANWLGSNWDCSCYNEGGERGGERGLGVRVFRG